MWPHDVTETKPSQTRPGQARPGRWKKVKEKLEEKCCCRFHSSTAAGAICFAYLSLPVCFPPCTHLQLQFFSPSFYKLKLKNVNLPYWQRWRRGAYLLLLPRHNWKKKEREKCTEAVRMEMEMKAEEREEGSNSRRGASVTRRLCRLIKFANSIKGEEEEEDWQRRQK